LFVWVGPKSTAPAPAPAASGPVEAAPKSEPKYVEDPVDPDLKKKYRCTIQAILRKRTFGAGDQALFDEFYQGWALSRWTVVKTIAKDADYRRELHRDLQTASSGPVHDHLNTLTLEYMNKLIADGYHPAVKANAMLMIGELNAVEQGPTTPPSPLPAALEALVAAVGNAKLSEDLRAAAMVGIRRYAALRIEDEEARRSVTSAMLKLVAAVDPPGESAAGPVTAGREWICRQAIDTLADLGSVGQNNAVYGALLTTVADPKLSIFTRSTAAGSLGRLNYTGATGINAVDAAAALGQFVIDACKEELRRAKQLGLEKELAERRETTILDLLRRWTKQHLVAAWMALTGGGVPDDPHKGIGPLATEGDQRAFVDALRTAIEAKIGFFDDQKRVYEDLTPQVEELQKTLETWLQKKPK
jgi:hypothetical protein